jgi:hypothetical protein
MKEFYFGIVFVLFMSILVKKQAFLNVSLLSWYYFELFISRAYAFKRAWLQAYQASQKTEWVMLVATRD